MYCNIILWASFKAFKICYFDSWRNLSIMFLSVQQIKLITTRLTSASEGTIFIIPPLNSSEAPRSQLIWLSCASDPLPGRLFVTVDLSVDGLSFDPELEASGTLIDGSTPVISSNFSSNWLNKDEVQIQYEIRNSFSLTVRILKEENC